jgi:hypothetical protein
MEANKPEHDQRDELAFLTCAGIEYRRRPVSAAASVRGTQGIASWEPGSAHPHRPATARGVGWGTAPIRR